MRARKRDTESRQSDAVMHSGDMARSTEAGELVAVVRCSSYDEARVYESITAALRLIRFAIKPGTKILLKPNVLGASPAERGVTTHPAVIAALCQLLQEKKCSITIADSCGRSHEGSTIDAFKACGIAAVAERFNAKLVAFERDALVRKKITGRFLHELDIPRSLLDAELVINLPKLKTHMLVGSTGAVKNMFGIVVGKRKRLLHSSFPDPDEFAAMLIDVYDAAPPQLHIMDAVVGMEGNGPSMGRLKETGLILASTSGPAMDFAAAELIGFGERFVLTNKMLAAQGRKPLFRVVGEQGVRIPYQKPVSAYRTSSKLFLKRFSWIMEQATPCIMIDQKRCRLCLACVRACPAGALSERNGRILVEPKKCILCYCCHELCPHGAVIIHQPFIARCMQKVRKQKGV